MQDNGDPEREAPAVKRVQEAWQPAQEPAWSEGSAMCLTSTKEREWTAGMYTSKQWMISLGSGGSDARGAQAGVGSQNMRQRQTTVYRFMSV